MENKETEKIGFFEGMGILIKEEFARRRSEPWSALSDIVLFAVAFLFSRCHIAFGAYPLGISFVAMLPRGVWISLIGVVTGSLSLGRSGIIHAVVALIVVFLRVVISGGEDRGGAVFRESLILKLAASVIGAFIGAAYEVLLEGFSMKGVLYGCASVLFALAFTFAFSGILDGDISFSEFLSSKSRIFHRKGEREKVEVCIFQGSFLLFVFLLSFSLREYNILGISPSYLFASFITLITARRFGALRGMAVGFVSCIGISGLYSAAFALGGLAAGLLMKGSITFALSAAGVLISFWGAYVGGVTGFLSLFPEYVTAALLSVPLLKKLSSVGETDADVENPCMGASDMVMTCAVTYKNSKLEEYTALGDTLRTLSATLKNFGVGEGCIRREEYRDIAIECAKEFCKGCYSYNACILENPAPCVENIDLIATKLYKNERLHSNDASIVPKYCHNSANLFAEITKVSGDLEKARYKTKKIESISELYELNARLISETAASGERERRVDAELSDKLTAHFIEAGLIGAVVKVYGERRKHVIAAAPDPDGKTISSKKLKEEIEEIMGMRLGKQEFYRKGDVALFECSVEEMYAVEFAEAGMPYSDREVSGDTAVSFNGTGGRFYALISDGMGSGDQARKTSQFCADLLSGILSSETSKSTALHILNHIIRNGEGECSATVDLFEFDLCTGEAVFYKCGAAASYVKRDSSIFRIRSETAPIGLMKNIDAERVRVEVKRGDYIIMLSDGVSQSPEDAAWLLEFLTRPVTAGVKEYADAILSLSKENSKLCDDMSVCVVKISSADAESEV